MPPENGNTVAQSKSDLLSLPLNIIALIVSYLDNVADMARLCQASRLLRYMTLPQLYESICLHAYLDIRYVNGRPEGFGSSSPFSTALNTLVTRTAASLVKSFSLKGEIREYDLEECAKAGRVSDSSMILNSLVRCAVDRMPILESFRYDLSYYLQTWADGYSWELSTKLCQTVYEGLRERPKLKSLTIRCPSTRAARPVVLLPAFPKLESLKITHIDPLCYPDDFSLLLAESPTIRHLSLSWSPRMRLESEPSVDLHSFFGRSIAARRRLRLQSVAFVNLYSQRNVDFDAVFDPSAIEQLTLINGSAGNISDPANIFLDNTWRRESANRQPPNIKNVKSVRFNGFYSRDTGFLAFTGALERLYFVNPRPDSSRSPAAADALDAATLAAREIQDEYLRLIMTIHGPSLRHLLLPAAWVLDAPAIRALTAACPNLTQLALPLPAGAPFESLHEALQDLLRACPRLVALRVLRAHAAPAPSPLDDAMERSVVAEGLARAGAKHLRWAQLAGRVWRCERVPRDGGAGWRFNVAPAPEAAVRDVEVWSMDSFEA